MAERGAPEGDGVPGRPVAAGDAAGASAAVDATRADPLPAADSAGSGRSDPACPPARRRRHVNGLWLAILGVSLGLFVIRFLVPTPVGQADNHDGPRLLCTLGVAPVTGGHARWFQYAYFQYRAGRPCPAPYPSSQLVPLELARLLTPVLGLPGTLNLIALGLLTCVIVSAGIASLATGLRLRPWAQLAVAAVVWVIMADAAFFDVWASPYSEPAALMGLLLVAAGVVRRARTVGLALTGIGALLAILSKEQYVIVIVPVGLTLVLASLSPGRGLSLARFRTRRTAAASAVTGLLVIMTGGYAYLDSISASAPRLHHNQAVNVIFRDIVTRKDAAARADLRALGLPASWVRYAGRNSFVRDSVRTDPLFPRYEAELSAANIAHFLLTHPSRIISVGQHAAELALRVRNSGEGSYPPSAHHRRGAVETRVIVWTWLMRQLPAGVGLLFLVPLWLAMAAIGTAALSMRRTRDWHRDAAVLVLCMAGCAVAAFIPPAYFDGVSTTRHMVGMNLATALAATGSVALAASVTSQAATRARRRRLAAPVSSRSDPDRTGIPD